jgi:hypothetical protein
MAIASLKKPPKNMLVICNIGEPRIAPHCVVQLTDTVWNLLVPYRHTSMPDRFDEVIWGRHELRRGDDSKEKYSQEREHGGRCICSLIIQVKVGKPAQNSILNEKCQETDFR